MGNAMIFDLADETKANLIKIIQLKEYWVGFDRRLEDPAAEMIRLAQLHKPGIWLHFPMVAIGVEGKPTDYIWRRQPGVLCFGEFMSMRQRGNDSKAFWLQVVWMQDNFAPHMSDENRASFARLDWDALAKHHPLPQPPVAR